VTIALVQGGANAGETLVGALPRSARRWRLRRAAQLVALRRCNRSITTSLRSRRAVSTACRCD